MEVESPVITPKTCPKEWPDWPEDRLMTLLNSLTVKQIANFFLASPAAYNFIKEHLDSLNDLNPYSIVVSDHFPSVANNEYEFYVRVNIGHLDADGSDEEIIVVDTEDKLRKVLSLLRPDIIDVRLCFGDSFCEDIEEALGRRLTEWELTELKISSLYHQVERERSRLVKYLASHGLTTEQFEKAKENVLHTSTPGDVPIDVYDTAMSFEDNVQARLLELSMAEGTLPGGIDTDYSARFESQKSNGENELC